MDRMRWLLARFDSPRLQAKGTQAGVIQSLIDDFEAIRKGRRDLGAARFNIFRLLEFGADEVRHTQILAWLMRKDEDHGQGNLFFRALAECAELPLHDADFESYRVAAEYAGLEAITDIVIFSPGRFAIAIENKIHAAEGIDQTNREARDLLRLASAFGIPSSRCYGLFISPDGREPASRGIIPWTPLAQRVLTTGFMAGLEAIRDDKLREFIRDLHEAAADWRSNEGT